jgi:hypothetical protein
MVQGLELRVCISVGFGFRLKFYKFSGGGFRV